MAQEGSVRRVSVLGASGSIGRSTIAVIEELRANGAAIEVEAIAVGRDVDAAAEAARRLRPTFVAIADPELGSALREALAASQVQAASGAGPEAVIEAGARPADWVMSAIVGAAGLAPTLAALRRGAHVAIANKESLVCAGPLMIAEAKAHGSRILPVDSEHNAIFQVLQDPAHVEGLTLTASGGPFRTWNKARMAAATPSEAKAHPNWAMGAKNSIDSATLINKGLELIEASYLFDMPEHAIDVLVHPQSIVHCLVRYCDGSVLAQLSAPDMRVPIAYALSWPGRAPVATPRLDLAAIGALTFEPPDLARFPGLAAARAAIAAGGSLPAVFNAANEVAVDAFLAERIGFLEIAAVVTATMDRAAAFAGETNAARRIEDVLEVDQWARRTAGKVIEAVVA
jgi:1-deoxy-D-xylulose-5-phosphate reductoisomerase